MAKKVYTGSVAYAIVAVINKQPNKQADLDILYTEVPKILGKDVSKDLIRGSIMRRTLGSKTGTYSVLFKRVSVKTYALAD